MDMELAAASLRADSSDVNVLVTALADQLGEALGGRLEVKRAGGLLRRSNQIRSLAITLDDDQYQAEVDNGTLRCSIGHSSGGIRIRSEKVDTDTWLGRLLGALKAEAAHSQNVREALERIVIGGSG
jgi:hypothetical protein